MFLRDERWGMVFRLFLPGNVVPLPTKFKWRETRLNTALLLLRKPTKEYLFINDKVDVIFAIFLQDNSWDTKYLFRHLIKTVIFVNRKFKYTSINFHNLWTHTFDFRERYPASKIRETSLVFILLKISIQILLETFTN